MAGVAYTISKFYGSAPKVSPELLPDTVAQIAQNMDISSGDLQSYRKSSTVATLDKVGTIKTIYPMDDGVGGQKWLHWTTDVDIATAQVETATDQRIYYTGDGVPKVTNYTLATSGAQFPTQSYTLGLPIPTAVPGCTPTPFAQKTSVSRARDAGGTATVVVTGHGLTTGKYVTTTTFGGTGYNLVNSPVTVIDANTISYFTFGAAETTTADTAGRIDLAGVVGARSYVYTFLTAWGEESMPSAPSPAVFVKEGQTCTVTGLPTTWTFGAGYQTAGMKIRVYRTVVGTASTEYYRVAEFAIGPATYVDTTNVTDLGADLALTSTDYAPPEPTMQGLVSIHNGMMVGFFGKTVCFCEPNLPHAWPVEYQKQVDADIVGIGTFGTTILVLTNKTPWRMDGNNPDVQSMTRTDFVLPCLSKESIVNIGFGVMWASVGGLAVYSASIVGTEYLTKNVHSWVSWPQAVNPNNLIGAYYRGRYFGSDGTNTFIFERNDQVGGHLVTTAETFSAAHYVPSTDSFYYASGNTVYLWNSPEMGPHVLDWKSKVFTTKGYINLGAARVIADYSTPEGALALATVNAAIIIDNLAKIAAGTEGGAMCEDDIGLIAVSGSRLVPLEQPDYTATFQLYVNKQLAFTKLCTNDLPFRLPTGYRADKFEVRVATTARVRAIHLAETVTGLKGV